MAEAATIARPYAKAAFAHARDAKVLGEWSQALRLGAGMIADARVAELVSSPKLEPAQLVEFFKGLAGPGAADAPWQNFIHELVENKRLHQLPEIAAQYAALRADYENEIDVQVTSAVALDDARRTRLAAALKVRLKRDVRITTAVDPTLLGGAVIRAGDLVIDGSLQGRLQRLTSELTA